MNRMCHILTTEYYSSKKGTNYDTHYNSDAHQKCKLSKRSQMRNYVLSNSILMKGSGMQIYGDSQHVSGGLGLQGAGR